MPYPKSKLEHKEPPQIPSQPKNATINKSSMPPPNLIKYQTTTLTTSVEDAGAGLLSDVQRGDGHLRDLVQSGVIGDGSNNHGDQTLTSGLLHVTCQARQR